MMIFSKHKKALFIIFLSILLAGALLFLIYFYCVSRAPIFPYLQNVSQNSIEIMWQTKNSSLGTVVYGPTNEYGQISKEVSKNTLHKIKITGLQPGTVYYYKVADGTETSGSIFKTAPLPGSAFNFLVLGDIAGNNNKPRTAFYEPAAKVCNAIARNAADPKTLVFQLGDHINAGFDDEWQGQFFTPCKDVLSNNVLYNVYGNHDALQNSPAMFAKYFGKTYYSFDYGNAHFLVINGNDAPGLAKGGDQRKWITEDLNSQRAQKATWRIVFVHKPPVVYSSGHGPDPVTEPLLDEVLSPAGVDIVFAGHAHIYQRLYKPEPNSPKGGVALVVSGGGGANLYNPLPGQYVQKSVFGYNYCVVNSTAGQLKITVYNTNNEVIDYFSVK